MFVRPLETRETALRLVAAGLNDCKIARRLDVPRTTIRDWRKPRYVPKRPASAACPRCGARSRRIVTEPETYVELLGLCLGDGHIAGLARTQRLRICLDAKYPDIVAAAEALMQRCFPDNTVRRVHFHDGREVVLDVYSSHLVCLFAQHGPGKKHERPIRPAPWQEALVAKAPWALLRGLIRSDGCVFVNRTGRCEYLSYDFANRSGDLLDLFESRCRNLGLRPRRSATSIRLYRREDVALLVEHVGVKA